MKRLLFLSLVLLALATAACTQSKPSSPTLTLVPINQTPVLPVVITETPAGPQSTAEPAVGATPGTDTNVPPPVEGTTAAPPAPTLLPTPTVGAVVQPPPTTGETPAPGPTTAPADGNPGGNPAGACSNPYTVQAGEYYYSIARKCGVSPQALIAANAGVGPLHPGTVITIPGGGGGAPPAAAPGGVPSGGNTYVVRPGDNLFRIALRFGTTIQVLMQLNGLATPYIRVGQVLRVP